MHAGQMHTVTDHFSLVIAGSVSLLLAARESFIPAPNDK
jgi:hypothetical protein